MITALQEHFTKNIKFESSETPTRTGMVTVNCSTAGQTMTELKVFRLAKYLRWRCASIESDDRLYYAFSVIVP